MVLEKTSLTSSISIARVRPSSAPPHYVFFCACRSSSALSNTHPSKKRESQHETYRKEPHDLDESSLCVEVEVNKPYEEDPVDIEPIGNDGSDERRIGSS